MLQRVAGMLLCLISFSTLSLGPATAQGPGCGLADRIRAANSDTAVGGCPAGTDHDVITLSEDITLSEALPPITSTITIEGGGYAISGDYKFRVFSLRGGNLTVNNLKLTRGRVPLQDDVYEGGGAIMLDGYSVLTVNDSVFEDNAAPDGGAIGSAYNSTPRITINNSSFIGNSSGSGGAIGTIRMHGGQIDIRDSSFLRNRSNNGGGAVNVLSQMQVNISNSTFKDNSARNGGAVSGEVGQITLTHVTMVNNSAGNEGDAIWTPSIRESYLSRARVNLYNSIVTGEFPLFVEGCYGRLNESAGNLSDQSCQPTVADEPLRGKASAAPLHYPLLDLSPALDAGDPRYCLPTDQLGNARPVGAGCDIGAIESLDAIPPPRPLPPICTLHDQIIAANIDAPVGTCPAGDGADSIFLLRDHVLAEKLPPITSDITIYGNGHRVSGDNKFGIFEVDGGRLVLRDLTLTQGASGEGGALRLRYRGSAIADNVLFLENTATAGGAIAAEHYNVRLEVRNSSFLRNHADEGGGAIYTNGGVIEIERSAFRGNTAVYYGGALHLANGRVRIVNSTLSRNSAIEGGGILVDGAEATLSHLTLHGNKASQLRGGGIYKQAGLLYLRNSLVSGSVGGDDCYGAPTQSVGSFSQDGSCAAASGDPGLGEWIGALGFFPLLDGSPALDAADPEFCAPDDQVGAIRPAGGGCDIGAIESGARSASDSPASASAECTLADQIIAANTDAPAGNCPAGNGADIITLRSDITLHEPLPQITSDISIRGQGHRIDGAGKFRIFDIGGDAQPKVSIKNLSLVKGNAPGEDGGAIRLSAGELVISDAILRDSQAANGGAIATGDGASLKVFNSRLSGNMAERRGGAISYGGCILIDWTVFFSQNRSALGLDDARKEISITRTSSGSGCDSDVLHFRVE